MFISSPHKRKIKSKIKKKENKLNEELNKCYQGDMAPMSIFVNIHKIK